LTFSATTIGLSPKMVKAAHSEQLQRLFEVHLGERSKNPQTPALSGAKQEKEQA
jgi:hypothetical protein